MKKIREYQSKIAINSKEILDRNKLVYIAMEVRTGKTATSFEVIKLYGAKNILFLTKKKAIKSIENDYIDFGYNDFFKLTVINDESMHLVNGNFDLVVHDEHHRFGSFPKPSNGAKKFKERFGNLPMIFLSGTPTPESDMQIFHQLWVCNATEQSNINFYKFYKLIGMPTIKFDLGFGYVNSYKGTKDDVFKYYGIKKREISKLDPLYSSKIESINNSQNNDLIKVNNALKILESIKSKYLITLTQTQAGFKSDVNENIIYVDMKPITYKLANRLIKDKVIVGNNDTILADTAVKLQSKLHQIYSGTVIFESGESGIIDDSKIVAIDSKFKNNKIAIFYKFKSEWDLIKRHYNDMVTNDINEFDSTNKNIALQIVSGREGISLKNAEYLIFLNIDFSATSYWQGRDRLSSMDRLKNNVYWVFARSGIEEKIYKAVLNKKNYTTKIFLKNYGI